MIAEPRVVGAALSGIGFIGEHFPLVQVDGRFVDVGLHTSMPRGATFCLHVSELVPDAIRLVEEGLRSGAGITDARRGTTVWQLVRANLTSPLDLQVSQNPKRAPFADVVKVHRTNLALSNGIRCLF